eukprot:12070130-Heterocapsa_arctica.AAC.1
MPGSVRWCPISDGLGAAQHNRLGRWRVVPAGVRRVTRLAARGGVGIIGQLQVDSDSTKRKDGR